MGNHVNRILGLCFCVFVFEFDFRTRMEMVWKKCGKMKRMR